MGGRGGKEVKEVEESEYRGVSERTNQGGLLSEKWIVEIEISELARSGG
jgi:hypothetical protein